MIQFSNIFKFTLVILLFVLAVPFLASATHLPDNEGHLVPQCRSITICEQINPDGSKSVVQATNVCTACDIFALANSIMRFLWWSISLPIAILMFAYAGFLMVVPGGAGEGTSSRLSKGKKIMTTTVVGIAIVFFSWLLIDTGIKALSPTGLGRGFGFWNKIDCAAPPPSSATPPRCPSYEDTNFEAGTEPPPLQTYTSYQERQAFDFLSTNGITHLTQCPLEADTQCPVEPNPQECFDRRNTGCIRLDKVHRGVLSELVFLRRECGKILYPVARSSDHTSGNCSVHVTGANEKGKHSSGQYSHETGYKVDVRLTQELESYIIGSKSGFRYEGVRSSDGARQYRNPQTDALYAIEGNHIDILVPQAYEYQEVAQ